MFMLVFNDGNFLQQTITLVLNFCLKFKNSRNATTIPEKEKKKKKRKKQTGGQVKRDTSQVRDFSVFLH